MKFEPHRFIQGSRALGGRHHGEALRSEKARHSLGWNAAGALAAYAAAADLKRTSSCQRRSDGQSNRVGILRARVTLVDGLISDCARMVGELKQEEGWFDRFHAQGALSRRGKKTMGYEVAEQLAGACRGGLSIRRAAE